MHTFHNLAGAKYDGCIPISVKTDDGKYRTAIDIAKATIHDTILPNKPTRRRNTRIVLLRKEDNKLKLFNPSDIIEEPTDFVVVNISDKTLGSCAKEGLIDIAKWLLAYGEKKSNNVITRAASGGHIEFAKWALENGFRWDDKNVIPSAAYYNQIEFAKWAYANGHPLNDRVITLTAYNGHLEFAKWAHANGCPWGNGVLSDAARGGQIEFVKWVRENGYYYDGGGNIITKAVICG
jgi:hypothetical protein